MRSAQGAGRGGREARALVREAGGGGAARARDPGVRLGFHVSARCRRAERGRARGLRGGVRSLVSRAHCEEAVRPPWPGLCVPTPVPARSLGRPAVTPHGWGRRSLPLALPVLPLSPPLFPRGVPSASPLSPAGTKGRAVGLHRSGAPKALCFRVPGVAGRSEVCVGGPLVLARGSPPLLLPPVRGRLDSEQLGSGRSQRPGEAGGCLQSSLAVGR